MRKVESIDGFKSKILKDQFIDVFRGSADPFGNVIYDLDLE